jgi:hypothetical protein
MARRSLRLTRFRDRSAFGATVDLLVALYPQRSREWFEAELSRLPVVLSHDADERAAQSFAEALERRGAQTHLAEADVASLPGWEEPSRPAGLEVDVNFLTQRRSGDRAAPPGHRAVPQGPVVRPASGKAPWES